MKALHELGILVRPPARPHRYCGGKLVDFSRSWTIPHPCLDFIDEEALQREKKLDTVGLKNAIDRWNVN
jgi:hypothetical protein